MNNTDLGKSPAFPKVAHQYFDGQSVVWADGKTGMDLRAYIATKAMCGVLNMVALTSDKYLVNDSFLNTDEVVKVALEITDKLIAELSKNQ